MLRRTLFGLSFACMAMAMALSYFTGPSQSLDRGYELTEYYQAADAVAAVDQSAPAAVLTERESIASARDAHAVAYAIANQPLATWRLAVDSYSRINPHI